MSNTKLTIGLVVVAVIAIIGLSFPINHTVQTTNPAPLGGVTNYDTLVLGTIPNSLDASTAIGSVSTQGTVYAGQGMFEGGVNSTSTPASMTMSTSDFKTQSLISINPNVGSITMTLPATTTDTTFLPAVGDCTWDVFFNATTTAGVNITLAAGTGYILQSASSTKSIIPNTSATLRLCRKTNTDILVMFVPFI